MASRTYLPQLLRLLRVVCNYIKRYEDQIRTRLTTEPQRAALDAVLAACEALEVILEAVIPPST